MDTDLLDLGEYACLSLVQLLTVEDTEYLESVGDAAAVGVDPVLAWTGRNRKTRLVPLWRRTLEHHRSVKPEIRTL